LLIRSVGIWTFFSIYAIRSRKRFFHCAEGEMDITRKLVDFCNNLIYGDLPPEVIDGAKYLALDFLGVASRGSLVDSTKAMYGLIEDLGLDSKGGVIIGTGMRAPYEYAALANGTSAHSLELDDVHNEGSLHPGVAVFPAAFAACEMAGADGKRLIEAVVAGYEVTIRVGKALTPSGHYGRGFHPTGTCGVFGAAVAASKVLGLDRGQMLSSMGIAGSQAAGSMEFLADGSWTKRFHPGWAAHSGLIAALLAKRGFKGPSTILEGRNGFLKGYSGSSDPGKILEGLDDSYHIVTTSIKPHACCRYKQAPIDGVLQIMEKNRLKPDEVERVTLGILKAGFPIVVTPEESKYNPRSVVDAQFSMPFGAAVAMLYGKASLEEYTMEKVNSPRVKEVMQKVSCVEDPELDKVFPKQWPATVKIVTRDGKSYSAKIDYPKGDPENPLTWDELIDKVNGLASSIYSASHREEIIQRTRHLDAERDLRKFTPLLLRDM
jgi:2-methylcitrate dehydratase PrpD